MFKLYKAQLYRTQGRFSTRAKQRVLLVPTSLPPLRLGSYLTAGRTYIRFSIISRQIQVCEWRSTGKPFLKSVNGFFPSCCQSIACLESCYLPEHMLSKFGGIPIWEEVPIYLLKLFHTQLAIGTILQEPLVPVIKTNTYLSLSLSKIVFTGSGKIPISNISVVSFGFVTTYRRIRLIKPDTWPLGRKRGI